MLAEVKPEIKPEVPVAASIGPSETTDRILVETQPSAPITNQPQEPPAAPLANFGWAPFEKNQAVPFVRRGSERYVANEIYSRTLLSHVYEVFSQQTAQCIQLKMARMTQREADVFNEVNVDHCDRSLVGQHLFREGDSMSSLEDVTKSMKYFQACENAVCHKIIENDLFGFLRIGSDSEVPFVWNQDEKLVPLFYFDGGSEYLEARAVDLNDRWQLSYLKFCCLTQNIRKDHYEKNPLKVVNFEYVKELFPAATTFQLHWPEKFNEELLAPEVRLAALYGIQEELPAALTEGGTPHSPEHNGIGISPAPCDTTQHSRNPNEVSPPRIVSKLAAYRKRPAAKQTRITSCQQLSYNGNDSIPEKDTHYGIAPMSTFSKRPKLQDHAHMPGTNEVSNVPYKSPQTASSPGLLFPSSPPIIEAGTEFQENERSSVVTQNVLNMHQRQDNVHLTDDQNRVSSLNSAPQQSPYIFQITPIMRENLRAYFLRCVGSMDLRLVRSKLRDIAWHFLIDHKRISFDEKNWLFPSLCFEVDRMWAEYEQSATLANVEQQYGATRIPTTSQFHPSSIVQNINVTNVTNVIQVQGNGNENHRQHHTNINNNEIYQNNAYYSSVSTSQVQPYQVSQGTTNHNNINSCLEHMSKVEVVKHIYLGWPDGETYTVKDCIIKKKKVLGISMSLMANEFLVNYSEFVKKCLGPKNSERLLICRFKRLFRLNSVQKLQWEKLVQSGRVEVQNSGFVKDIFVLYNEVLALL